MPRKRNKELHYTLGYYMLIKRKELPQEERDRIDRMSRALMERVKGLTELGALEILFQLGTFLNQKGVMRHGS